MWKQIFNIIFINIIDKIKYFTIFYIIFLHIIIILIVGNFGIKAICTNLPDSIKSDRFPQLPNIDISLAEEMTKICNNDECPQLMRWFGQISSFRGEYKIFQDEHK